MSSSIRIANRGYPYAIRFPKVFRREYNTTNDYIPKKNYIVISIKIILSKFIDFLISLAYCSFLAFIELIVVSYLAQYCNIKIPLIYDYAEHHAYLMEDMYYENMNYTYSQNDVTMIVIKKLIPYFVLVYGGPNFIFLRILSIFSRIKESSRYKDTYSI